jgi:hypothetical protein
MYFFLLLQSLQAVSQGYNVIHGEFTGSKRPAAVIATAIGKLTLPPLGLPQFPGLLPFSADGNIV